MDYKPRKNLFSRLQIDNSSYDWVLLGVVALLCVFGLAFLASTLSAEGAEIYQSEFLHQLIFGMWVGGVIAFLLARTNYHLLLKYKNVLLLTTIALLAFLAVFAGAVKILNFNDAQTRAFLAGFGALPIRPYLAGGAIRWIATPLSNFQPSELAKLTLLVYFADFLRSQRERLDWLTLKKPLYAFGLISSLILIQPDLGSVVLMAVILMSAMWVGGVPTKMLLTIATIAAIGGTYFAVATTYRNQRINALLSGNCDTPAAFQVCQVKAAIANGGLWGQGYGNSEFKQRKAIPEVSTDAILGVIGEEMGFVFTSLFLSLYLILFWRGLRIAQNTEDISGKVLATGISVWIVLQAFLNISGITGLTPLKGLPLPFVSEGGSSLVINLASVGILLNISSQTKVNQEVRKTAKKYFQAARRQENRP
jgi:cell division protein FtsW